MSAPKFVQLTYSTIDSLTLTTGRILSWLTAFMAITVTGIVVSRFVLGTGSIAVQESVTYMHACVFMLCMAYAAKEDAHVRVDLFYRRYTPLHKAWINTLGNIVFLLPFSFFLLFISWEMVSRAWAIQEGSSNPGGIHAVYLLKAMMPCCAVLLILHAIGDTLKQLTTLTYTPSDKA